MKENKVTLNDIAIFVRNGVSIKQDKKQIGFPITRIETISNGIVNLSRVGFAGITDIGKYRDYLLKDGDILVSHINSIEHLGKSAIYDNKDMQIIHGMNLLCVRPNKDIVLPKYLYYLFQTPSYKSQILRIANKSVNQASFPVSKFKSEIKFSIHSLGEQEEIVKELDKVSLLIEKRKEEIFLLDEYLASVFLDMFGDPVSNTKNYPQKQIDTIGKVLTGNTPPRKITSYYGDYIEWIKSDNLNNDNYYLTKATEYLSKEGSEKGRVVPSGSVLVTCIAGSLDCIGNTGIANREVSFNQQINAIVPNGNLVTTEFLFSQVMYGKELFRRASTNSMKGMLNKSNFSKIQLIVPPLEKQKIFSVIFNKVDKCKRRMKEQLLLLNDNFQKQLNTL